MNSSNTGQQLRYLEEVCISLHRAGFETKPSRKMPTPHPVERCAAVPTRGGGGGGRREGEGGGVVWGGGEGSVGGMVAGGCGRGSGGRGPLAGAFGVPAE